jgi:hypothetical protein
VIVPEGRATVFRGREVFRRVGEPDFTRTVPSIDRVHRIMNPFGQSWTMEVRAVSTWADTIALVVEFRVWDVARAMWLLSEQQFSKEKPVFTLRFATSPETPRHAEARTTRILADGTPVRGPWRDLAGPVVAVTDQVAAERRIRAKLDIPHFASAAVKKVNVELEYRPDPARPVLTGLMELASADAIADWTHPFPDPTRPRYRYRVKARGEAGERYSGLWEESGADDLTITLPPSPWA